MTNQHILEKIQDKLLQKGRIPIGIYALDIRLRHIEFLQAVAKILWGEDPWCIDCQEETIKLPNNTCGNCFERGCGLLWRCRLQEWIIAEDSNKYLEEHIT